MDDDRKGIIWIPEAHSGWCWRRFVAKLRSLLVALASIPGSSSEGSVLEDTSCGSLQGIKASRSFAEALRSPSGEVVNSLGPQLLLSQEIDLLPMANRFMLGYDGKEACFAWDCFELECGISAPLPVRVAALGWRKKWKHLGLLCLGLGLGKLDLGFPGLVSGLVGSGSGSSMISRPDLAVVLMVVDKQI